MVSLSTLAKTAAIGSVITLSAGILVSRYFELQVRKSKTYKKALEKVYNHEPTVKHLGQPVREGKITFKDSNNPDNVRQFSVDLKGSNTTGKLNCEFLINKEDASTELTKLEILFADLPNKILVIHENQ